MATYLFRTSARRTTYSFNPWARLLFAQPHLQAESWKRLNRAALVLVAGGALCVPWLSWTTGHGLQHGLLELFPLAFLAVIASWDWPRRIQGIITTLAAFLVASVVIHLLEGNVWSQTGILAALVITASYRDLAPWLVAGLFLVVQHALVGTIDPHSVYGHGAYTPLGLILLHTGAFAGLLSIFPPRSSSTPAHAP